MCVSARQAAADVNLKRRATRCVLDEDLRECDIRSWGSGDGLGEQKSS